MRYNTTKTEIEQEIHGNQMRCDALQKYIGELTKYSKELRTRTLETPLNTRRGTWGGLILQEAQEG